MGEDAQVDLEKLRSIGVQPRDRRGTTRTTRDVHGNDTTEHWSDDRVDVAINVREPVKLKASREG